MTKPTRRAVPPINTFTVGDILAALKFAPMTSLQISYRVHCKPNWARIVCLRLVDSGDIHIIDWRRQGCRTSAVFKAGAGKNMPQPQFGTPRKDSDSTRAKLAAGNRAAGNRAKREKIAAMANGTAVVQTPRLGVWGL